MVTIIAYWELNPDFDPSELAEVATQLIQKGLYPAEGIKQIAWYVSPDYWGVSISEAENEEANVREVNMWRIVKPGIFKVFKHTTAMQAIDILPILGKLAEKVKGK